MLRDTVIYPEGEPDDQKLAAYFPAELRFSVRDWEALFQENRESIFTHNGKFRALSPEQVQTLFAQIELTPLLAEKVGSLSLLAHMKTKMLQLSQEAQHKSYQAARSLGFHSSNVENRAPEQQAEAPLQPFLP